MPYDQYLHSPLVTNIHLERPSNVKKESTFSTSTELKDKSDFRDSEIQSPTYANPLIYPPQKYLAKNNK